MMEYQTSQRGCITLGRGARQSACSGGIGLMLGTLQKGHSRRGRLHTFPPTTSISPSVSTMLVDKFPVARSIFINFCSIQLFVSYSSTYPHNRRTCQNFFTQQIQMSHDQQEAMIPTLKTADNNSVIIIATSSLQVRNYRG